MVAAIRILSLAFFLGSLPYIGTANIVSNRLVAEPGQPVIGVSDELDRIAPNPADVYFEIMAKPDILLLEVRLLDMNGECVYLAYPNKDYVYVPTESIPNGLYTLVIITQRATHTTSMLIAHP